MARALLVVPPFIKYSSGPLLGPSLLQAAATTAGHHCTTLDLNARFIRWKQPSRLSVRTAFRGDHDKPIDKSLSRIEDAFVQETILPCCKVSIRQAMYGFMSHDIVEQAATRVTETEFGQWILHQLQNAVDVPDVVGLSLLHAGQVVPAATVTAISRTLWPRALIVWGGPHISGMGANTLKFDIRKRKFAADVFVVGHAEQTFVDILEMVRDRKQSVVPNILHGYRGDSFAPQFSDLDYYDLPLVFPAQSTLGCSYGRCAYCTYPAIEPTPTKLPLESSVLSVVRSAMQYPGATLSLKDSLLSPNRMQQISDCVDGRMLWSACTKLSPQYDFETLQKLSTQGLSTLEVGLESLLPETQQRIFKVQDPKLYQSLLTATSMVPDLSLVVNYMTGFPWEDPCDAESMRFETEQLLKKLFRTKGECLNTIRLSLSVCHRWLSTLKNLGWRCPNCVSGHGPLSLTVARSCWWC